MTTSEIAPAVPVSVICPKCGVDVLKSGVTVQITSYQCYFPTNGRLMRKHAFRSSIRHAHCVACSEPLTVPVDEIMQAVAQ